MGAGEAERAVGRVRRKENCRGYSGATPGLPNDAESSRLLASVKIYSSFLRLTNEVKMRTVS